VVVEVWQAVGGKILFWTSFQAMINKSRKFYQINVFSSQPYSGNPVAVVLNCDDLTPLQMQQFASWTNLSETTFLQTPSHPDADYAVRIFTTSRELPFAGHPTLGSCTAWLESGGRPKDSEVIVQECPQGLIKLRWMSTESLSSKSNFNSPSLPSPSTRILSFEAPKLNQSGPLDERELDHLIRGLGLCRDDIIAHSWCDNGPQWRGLLLNSSEKVLNLRPNQLMLELDVGVIGPHQRQEGRDKDDEEYDYEVRAFCPKDLSSFEDPVTGSLNAAMAQWLIGTGRAVSQEGYVVRQGTCVGRDGRVYVRTRQEQTPARRGVQQSEIESGCSCSEGCQSIWIGGTCTICMDGVVMI
jgi:PhzF family phenazine biosynthesis protein